MEVKCWVFAPPDKYPVSSCPGVQGPSTSADFCTRFESMETLKQNGLVEEPDLLVYPCLHRLGPGWAGAHRRLAEG